MNKKTLAEKQESPTNNMCENERLYFRLSNNNSLKSFRIAINFYKSIFETDFVVIVFHILPNTRSIEGGVQILVDQRN